MPPDNPAKESPDAQDDQRHSFARRTLLKALTAGAAVSLGSGVVAAAADESDENQNGGGDAEEIDPVFGFPTTDPAELPTDLAPDHEVELRTTVPEDPQNPDHPPFFYFEPSGLQVNAGEIVQFTSSHPDHTVTTYHPANGYQRRTPEDAPPFSSPVVPMGGAWLYQFEHEGLYDLYCGPHRVFGMNMRIVVGEMAAEDVPDYEDTFEAEPPLLTPFDKDRLEHELNMLSDENEECEWPWLTPRQLLTTDALDPMHIQEQGEVPYQTVADELGIAFEPEEPEETDEPADETAAATVQVREHPALGDILVGPDEMTLYLFVPDEANPQSTCQGPCAATWPPLTVTDEPTAGNGVTAELDTFERRDSGEMQVTANGWPLYHFTEDQEPGDANGQGIEDVWFTLSPDGTANRPQF